MKIKRKLIHDAVLDGICDFNINSAEIRTVTHKNGNNRSLVDVITEHVWKKIKAEDQT